VELGLELLLILVLVGINGVFAMSELAIVSARRTRLQAMEKAGNLGAAAALRLAEEPQRFLPTVQVGITLVGILAGAFGGARLAGYIADLLGGAGVPESVADDAAFFLVVVLITYLSLILGELVPKQLALRNAEAVASSISRPLELLARISAPVVWLLGKSSGLVLRLLGKPKDEGPSMTEEEVKAVVAEGAAAGVLEAEERDMIGRVLRLADRPVRAIMTPRNDVAWIDRNEAPQDIAARIKASAHSRFVVCEGSVDNVIGILQAKDVLDQMLDGEPLSVDRVLRKAVIMPDTVTALDALEQLKADPLGLAVVLDEYGSFEGVVTSADVLEAIVGELSEGNATPDDCVVRPDGSLLMDGMMPVDEVKTRLGLESVPAEGSYHTLAGLILALLRRLPRTGDRIVHAGWRFEVVDMDGRRVDKVLATREETTDVAEAA
jgi:putative hemolysin